MSLGIHLGASPRSTFACMIDWPHEGGLGHPHVHAAIGNLTDDALLGQLQQANDVVGIDAPFGWPSAFVDFVALYQHPLLQGAPHLNWNNPAAVQAHRRRATDQALRAQLPNPLPALFDERVFGAVTLRCANLLVAAGVHNRSGAQGVFEVYSRGALEVWVGGVGRYGADRGLREQIVVALGAALGVPLDPQFWGNRGRLDALVAALVARAASVGLTHPPPGGLLAQAAVEGWTHMPVHGHGGLAGLVQP